MPALANPSRETSVFIRGELPGFSPLYLYRPTKTDGLHVSAFETKREEVWSMLPGSRINPTRWSRSMKTQIDRKRNVNSSSRAQELTNKRTVLSFFVPVYLFSFLIGNVRLQQCAGWEKKHLGSSRFVYRTAESCKGNFESSRVPFLFPDQVRDEKKIRERCFSSANDGLWSYRVINIFKIHRAVKLIPPPCAGNRFADHNEWPNRIQWSVIFFLNSYKFIICFAFQSIRTTKAVKTTNL